MIYEKLAKKIYDEEEEEWTYEEVEFKKESRRPRRISKNQNVKNQKKTNLPEIVPEATSSKDIWDTL